jgi:hypothetical protein
MLRNVELAPKVYPDWLLVLHISCPAYAAHLDAGATWPRELAPKSHVRLVLHEEPESRASLFWRIETAFDRAYERVLIRDCDSRLNIREADAVHEWIASGKALHSMRDHPRHNIPLMGGMWGVRTEAMTPRMRELLTIWETTVRKGDYPHGMQRVVRVQSDQNYLYNAVWPFLRLDACVHDDRRLTGPQDKRFRVMLPAGRFVGQQVTEKEVYLCPK